MPTKFKTLYNDVLRNATYGHSAAYLPKWDKATKEWVYPTPGTFEFDCTTSINFILAYMLNLGEEGYDPNVKDTNLPKAAAGIAPFSNYFQNLGLKLLLPPNSTIDSRLAVEKLARGGSTYSKVDDWYYSKMPWKKEKEVTCKCGIHLSPKYILNMKNQLSTVNIASVSIGNSLWNDNELTPIFPNQRSIIQEGVTNKDNKLY